jgi:hypothetical protein
MTGRLQFVICDNKRRYLGVLCRAILHKDLHPYPYQVNAACELVPADLQRLQFCQCFLNTLHNNDNVLQYIIFLGTLNENGNFTYSQADEK